MANLVTLITFERASVAVKYVLLQSFQPFSYETSFPRSADATNSPPPYENVYGVGVGVGVVAAAAKGK